MFAVTATHPRTPRVIPTHVFRAGGSKHLYYLERVVEIWTTIAWQCSGSYGVWLALLVWNGWFWDWAAYRNHRDSEACDILFEQDRMAMCIGIAIHVAIYALFPILCYFDRRTERVKALH